MIAVRLFGLLLSNDKSWVEPKIKAQTRER